MNVTQSLCYIESQNAIPSRGIKSGKQRKKANNHIAGCHMYTATNMIHLFFWVRGVKARKRFSFTVGMLSCGREKVWGWEKVDWFFPLPCELENILWLQIKCCLNESTLDGSFIRGLSKLVQMKCFPSIKELFWFMRVLFNYKHTNISNCD